jgi:hypothetical protein
MTCLNTAPPRACALLFPPAQTLPRSCSNFASNFSQFEVIWEKFGILFASSKIRDKCGDGFYIICWSTFRGEVMYFISSEF